MNWRQPTLRERAVDWAFQGFGIGLLVFLLCACFGYATGPASLQCLKLSALLGVLAWVTSFAAGVAGKSWRNWVMLAAGFALVVVTIAMAHAGEVAPHSVRYRVALEQAAGEQFGIDAPVSLFASQVQAESAWDPHAESPYAQGLAQFTPATAQWLPKICPDIGEPDPWDANWSIRALACYDAHLYASTSAATQCARWAFTLADYNGGRTNRVRDQALTKQRGHDPARWFGNVENYSARAPAAFRENRHYVRKILLDLTPAYVDAGWPGEDICQ